MTTHAKVYRPTHPKASASGDIYAHVEVAERALGRVLPQGVEVHHVDCNPRNNAARNLVICQDKAYHKLLHVRMRVVRLGGDPNTQRVCSTCRQLKPFAGFNKAANNKSDGIQRSCRECSHAYTKTYVRRERVS